VFAIGRIMPVTGHSVLHALPIRLRASRKALIPAALDGGTGNGTGHFQRLPGHTDFVNAVVALQSDSLFASASADISVRIWDGSKGTLVSVVAGPLRAFWGQLLGSLAVLVHVVLFGAGGVPMTVQSIAY
jgi:WD40 repeat protein